MTASGRDPPAPVAVGVQSAAGETGGTSRDQSSLVTLGDICDTALVVAHS